MRTLLSGSWTDDRSAQDLLVEDSRIAWIGPRGQAPKADRIVDLTGCLLLPAFVDAHVHTTATGISLTGLDLHGAPSLPAALARIAAHAQATPGRLIFGAGWDETTWPERRAPSRRELDAATRGAPAYLARVDAHSAVVSTALLDRCPQARECAGFDRSGHLRQEAHHAVRRAAQSAITADQRRGAQRAARAHAAGIGISAIHEMAGPDISGRTDLEDLLDLARNESGPQVFGYWGELGQTAIVGELGLSGAGGDLFCDGAFGSHTAALHEPYLDAPSSTGVLYFSDAEVAEHLRQTTIQGIQAGFHCIGDAAIDQVARGFEMVAAELGDPALRLCRHRLEHLEMPSRSALTTFARLDVLASVQPAFDAAWGGRGRMYETRLGSDRCARLNPFADCAAAGMRMALGSDAPVTAMDPWATIAAAVGHRRQGSGLSPYQAMAAATVGGWAATRDPRPGVGTIAIGAPAHLAAWDLPDNGINSANELIISLVHGGPQPDCRLTVTDGLIIHGAEQ